MLCLPPSCWPRRAGHAKCLCPHTTTHSLRCPAHHAATPSRRPGSCGATCSWCSHSQSAPAKPAEAGPCDCGNDLHAQQAAASPPQRPAAYREPPTASQAQALLRGRTSGSRSSGCGSADVEAICQSTLRAKPCCCIASEGPNCGRGHHGRGAPWVMCWSGGAEAVCRTQLQDPQSPAASPAVSRCFPNPPYPPHPTCGKQCGMPPLMGLDLSNTASGRMYSTSSPEACFQLVMQAPAGGNSGQDGGANTRAGIVMRLRRRPHAHQSRRCSGRTGSSHMPVTCPSPPKHAHQTVSLLLRSRMHAAAARWAGHLGQR